MIEQLVAENEEADTDEAGKIFHDVERYRA